MHFGKNIKKIRLIKKLSQTAFAETFGLKRSSIGAYEEGRAEPKLEMIIRIAKHFGVTVDSLVNSELKVNELYGLDIVDSYLGGLDGADVDNLKKIVIESVPLISTLDILLNSVVDAQNNSEIEICLPELSSGNLAIRIDNTKIKYLPPQIHNNDLVVVDPEFNFEGDEFHVERIYFIKWNNNLGFGEVKQIGDVEYLFISNGTMPLVIPKNEIHFIFPVEKHISNNPIVYQNESETIQKLESLVNDLYTRIK